MTGNLNLLTVVGRFTEVEMAGTGGPWVLSRYSLVVEKILNETLSSKPRSTNAPMLSPEREVLSRESVCFSDLLRPNSRHSKTVCREASRTAR